MTRKRWVTFSNRITGSLKVIRKSDVEHKRILILPEHRVADKQADKRANEGGNDRRRFRQLAVVDRQAKSVDDVNDRIQLKDPLIVPGQHVERIDDGRHVK